jgi:transposase InsO family protein
MLYFSIWSKLVESVAWLLRFKEYCKYRFLKRAGKCSTGLLTLPELRKSVHAIIQHVQRTSFSDDYQYLHKGHAVRKTSRLSKLNPVIYNNMICMNGRVNNAEKSTFPAILPSNHHVTKLIILSIHETQGHVGTQQVLAATRQKYWIINGLSTVKKVVKKCLPCIRQRGPLCLQQMAPLREEQTTPDKPPFSFVGVDFFGPMTVRSGRNHLKRYGCLFTCLASRAVHIEIVHSMDTDSFISAFRRFSSRRGQPEKLFSDNGTNLVSGDRELRKSIQDFNRTKIGKFMLQREVEWHFNPPCASHMGGMWERLIRSTRQILKALVKEQLLNDEQLLTLMAEVERIINDRPITDVSDDPNDPLALTPSMLLLMKGNSCVPPGNFCKTDVYAKRWWKQVQYLAGVFWKRWLREYLPSLQQRHKWQKVRKDIRKDDVVLVADENIPRGQWPLGRVIEVNVGRDGHVRSCVVRLSKSTVVRPITKLCLLEFSE